MAIPSRGEALATPRKHLRIALRESGHHSPSEVAGLQRLGELSTSGDAEDRIGLVKSVLDGPQAQAELNGDRLVRNASRREHRDVELPRGEGRTGAGHRA